MFCNFDKATIQMETMIELQLQKDNETRPRVKGLKDGSISSNIYFDEFKVLFQRHPKW
jgi:hypothetical protein